MGCSHFSRRLHHEKRRIIKGSIPGSSLKCSLQEAQIKRCLCRLFSSASDHYDSNGVSVSIQSGLSSFRIPLPSRKESCLFNLKPITNSIGDLASALQLEDQGVDKLAFYSKDGNRYSQGTSLQHLFQQTVTEGGDSLSMHLNDKIFNVHLSQEVTDAFTVRDVKDESVKQVEEAKVMISKLFQTINGHDFQKEQEQKLLDHLEALTAEIAPLQKIKNEIDGRSHKIIRFLKYGGLAVMSLQMGVFARLTWWEYSWDIMEPVTYFATYSTLVIFYMYFLCAGESYEYETAFNRLFLHRFHKRAKKANFDIERYNQIKNAIFLVEYDLRRLRDPLNVSLPIVQLGPFDTPSSQAAVHSALGHQPSTSSSS